MIVLDLKTSNGTLKYLLGVGIDVICHCHLLPSTRCINIKKPKTLIHIVKRNNYEVIYMYNVHLKSLHAAHMNYDGFFFGN